MMTAASSDKAALSRNTQALPKLAISAPASNGPMMREAFMDTPLSPSAAGNWARGMRSGTIAANTGQRIARPMPLVKTSSSSSSGDNRSRNTIRLSTVATTAIHSWVMRK